MILATDKPYHSNCQQADTSGNRSTSPHYTALPEFKLKQKTTIPWTAAYEVTKPTTHFSVHGLDHSFNAHFPISIHDANTAPLQKDEAESNVTFHRSWTKQASPYRCVTHILRMMPSSTSSFEDDVLSRPACEAILFLEPKMNVRSVQHCVSRRRKRTQTLTTTDVLKTAVKVRAAC